jgi:hypothetical protein
MKEGLMYTETGGKCIKDERKGETSQMLRGRTKVAYLSLFKFRHLKKWFSTCGSRNNIGNGEKKQLQIRRPGFDSRHYQKKSSGSGTGSTQPREYN